MGCCVTKPKVLKKGKDAAVPVPIPPSRQGKRPIQDEKKAEAKAEADQNHHANRRGSLSNLLEEEMKMDAKTPSGLTRSKSSEYVAEELLKSAPTDTTKPKEIGVVTSEGTKEPMTEVKDTGNRNSGSVQYIEARSVHDIVADIERLNKPKPNVVTKNGTEEPKKPLEWMYKPFPVPVALRKIELGRSAESKPTTPKAATDTERLKRTDVVIHREIKDPVKPFEHNDDVIEPEPSPVIPKDMIMNLKLEEIAYEIEQLYKPDMLDLFPRNIKSGKSEPEASTDTGKLKDVNAITNPKIEQICRPDPADVAPGNTESIRPTEAESAPETAAADTKKLNETSIPTQPMEAETAPETAAAAADTEKQRKTDVSINQEPAKPRKVVEHIHKPEQVPIAQRN